MSAGSFHAVVPGAGGDSGMGRDEEGSRFLFAVAVSPPPPFTIVRDWQSALPKERTETGDGPRTVPVGTQ